MSMRAPSGAWVLMESVMPNSTINAPGAADPIDRLTLGATDPREGVAEGRMSIGVASCSYQGQCMAEG